MESKFLTMFDKSQPLLCILSQIHPLTLPQSFLSSVLTSVPHVPRFSRWSLPFRFFDKTCMLFLWLVTKYSDDNLFQTPVTPCVWNRFLGWCTQDSCSCMGCPRLDLAW